MAYITITNRPKILFSFIGVFESDNGSGNGDAQMGQLDPMLYLDAALEVDHGGRGGTSNSDVHIAFSTIEGIHCIGYL